MYKVGLKFSASSYIKDFTSWDTKESIISKIREAFRDDAIYKVYESKHNIVVEHSKYNDSTNAKTILRIVFDDVGSVVAIYLLDNKSVEFDSIILGTEEIKHNDLAAFIEKQKGSEIISYCPYTDERVDSDLIRGNTDTKLCNTEEKCCKDCLRRSRAYVSADIKKEELYLEYSIEQYDSLLIVDSKLKNKVDELYGYYKDIDELGIIDNNNEENNIVDDLIIDGIKY